MYVIKIHQRYRRTDEILIAIQRYVLRAVKMPAGGVAINCPVRRGQYQACR